MTANGADLAATAHFGSHFQVCEAVGYNTSKYDADYQSGSSIVDTASKMVLLTPDWLEKFIISGHWGPLEEQLSSD